MAMSTTQMFMPLIKHRSFQTTQTRKQLILQARMVFSLVLIPFWNAAPVPFWHVRTESEQIPNRPQASFPERSQSKLQLNDF